MPALAIKQEIRADVQAPKRQLAEVLTPPAGSNLSASDKAIAEQRYAIIEPLISTGRHQSAGTADLNRGDILAVICKQHSVTRSTVYNWIKAFTASGLPGLVKKDRADKGQPRSLNNVALEFLLAAAMPRRGSYGCLSVKEICRAYREEREWRATHTGKRLGEPESKRYARYLDEDGRLSADAALPDASYATFRRWFEKIPTTVKTMARTGHESYTNTQEILSFRNLTELLPLDYVVMDHRQLDLFCLAQQGDGWKLIRPWLTAAIDMRTRKWLAWDIVESPSSDSIASVLKKIFLKYGLPGALYWDNGKDFRCEWFEGNSHRCGSAFRVAELNEGFRGVLETLNVRVHHAIVRRARSKIIEPNFVNTANFDRSLPTWCGHRPTARPERFGELMKQHERWLKNECRETPFQTISQIAWLYDEFLGTTLNERDHTGEGMQKITPTGRAWMCPNECWERFIGNVPRRRADPEVIQFCFRKRRESTVRNGEIRVTFVGREYHYRIAEAPTKLMTLNGKKVEMAYDPYDLETIAVYHEGCFLGLAENLELRKMGEQVFVEDERLRRAARREVRQLIKDVHTAVPVASAEERALRRIAVAPERREPHRIGVEAAIPAGVALAVEAVRNSRNVDMSRIEVELVPATTETVDDNFDFFNDDD